MSIAIVISSQNHATHTKIMKKVQMTFRNGWVVTSTFSPRGGGLARALRPGRETARSPAMVRLGADECKVPSRGTPSRDTVRSAGARRTPPMATRENRPPPPAGYECEQRDRDREEAVAERLHASGAPAAARWGGVLRDRSRAVPWPRPANV